MIALLTGITLVLVPWTLWLSVVLPAKHTTHDWDATWVGFDIVLLVTLGLTAIAYRKRSPALPMVATAAGVLLYADAWFDNWLSGAAVSSIVLALVGEIPLGTLCLWLAGGALRPRKRYATTPTGSPTRTAPDVRMSARRPPRWTSARSNEPRRL